jgi:UDP-GlcNAc:undecaprenyl-phosphate GlcNAc-1-phosphate transferase
MNALWLTFNVTLFASLALTPLARWLAVRSGAVDCPDGGRKRQKAPVPLWGGLSVYLALALGLMCARWSPFPVPDGFAELSWVILAAAGFVCLLGAVDDSRDLDAKFKLLLQIVSVLPVVLAGWAFDCMQAVDSVALFGFRLQLGWLGIPFTMLWLIGCINAVNLLDGMDGLASVVGLSTAVILALIASTLGHPHVALAAVGLAGALAGFLAYNLPPAKIYLGDCGSMVIGMIVGILSIQGSLKTAATLSLTVPAVVMTIPLLDTALAILRRRLTGQPFHSPDRGHIHHRLLDRGLSTWQALCIIGSLCLATGAAAAAATIFRSDAVAWLITLVLIVLMVRLRTVGHYEVSLVKDRAASLLTRWAERLTLSTSLNRRTVLDPASTTLAELWRALTKEVADCHAHRLQVTLDIAGRRCGQCAWSGDDGDDAGPQWSLSLSFGRRESVLCQITAAGRHPPEAETWSLLHLASVLRLYGEHWLAHPDEVPHVLPLERTFADRSEAA